jgi:hypothetical protein
MEQFLLIVYLVTGGWDHETRTGFNFHTFDNKADCELAVSKMETMVNRWHRTGKENLKVPISYSAECFKLSATIKEPIILQLPTKSQDLINVPLSNPLTTFSERDHKRWDD